MSDTMLHSILQMPPELWTNDAIDIAQRHGRYLEASKRIIELERERDEARMKWREAWDGWNEALEERNEARKGWSKALEERDEARRELAELRKKLYDSDAVMKWAESKVEELNKGIIRLITERNQAREIARLAFYIIRGVDPKFVKLAYERSVYWNGQDQPIQFMRDAIKAWDKEKKEEA